ncbi:MULTISPECIES: lytic transglycosylase domain-containing protein [unclassified Bradyrhizobium]|uniref:lytic transglycosylase domain-containing protein n=1 Tax=unclassified Bradyrhizobium TaxID=2631580 RepID=UPI001BA751DE|nr:MULTISPECIES: lytic transglycosylase domain-containing protein [unclassified Bradyrhizobium]MBR1201505.1 lytic transglycosylase domain-containing protein [Bradyrhizobium sp. AUGA SZCCT0124]MBR1310661.1 lytic transglycosylase domain-containing protein [Bradyrhizobium sp. AUGA SZCCT0051]MBR1340804.1 lytic transglycosylase domain-containing protein [Bradyrhizobium sp. AUGA SZCCT0105]MBR1355410.1 lytic transglycosylase domain-containing protein [Bradyrhizobium sp. AUGA SZCCT0045]
MKTLQSLSCLAAAIAVLASCASARAQSRAQYEAIVAAEAQANLVPEELVHRVIVRESKYHPQLIGRGGAIGMMQIKLATARGVGYTGTAEGLRDAATNLKYGVKYLAGAYRAANGDFDRAVRYFAGGYYYVAKRQRGGHLQEAMHGGAGVPPKELAKQEKMSAETAEPKPEQAPK